MIRDNGHLYEPAASPPQQLDPDVVRNGPLSVLDLHNPLASPAPSIDPPSTGFDIGNLGKGRK